MTRRWVMITWATRSRTVQSEHEVGEDQSSGLIPSTRMVNPWVTTCPFPMVAGAGLGVNYEGPGASGGIRFSTLTVPLTTP
jgi:hypothetical protein